MKDLEKEKERKEGGERIKEMAREKEKSYICK
jgi:hypothetical protein